jgi:hypothetical protein
MKKLLIVLSIAILSTSSVYAQEHATPTKSYSPYAGSDQPRNVYWGDTHLHTTYSPDAGLTGNEKLTPADAYRFARGEEVEAHNGMKAKLNRPLDFLVVTDHAEYMGIVPLIRDSDPQLLKNEWGKRWHDMYKAGPDQALAAALEIVSGSIATGEQRIKDDNITRSVWDLQTSTADKYNNPGHFTAFIGYEWTTMPKGNNLHRVVIFKDGAGKASQVLPFSAFDSEDPEDLWAFLESYEKKTGGEIMALAHNGNVSNGLMFSDKTVEGKPLSRAYAKMRSRWEPLYEVTQMKGDGEAHPYLSPNDEFADYETWDKGNLDGTSAKKKSMLEYEYARSALKLGLKHEENLGVNPFKFGLIGSTDAHTALATSEEDNQWGKLTSKEPNNHRAETPIIPSKTPGLTTWGFEQAASGYAAVWAKENTRASLFEAMQRRETYATTGPRITVRFFGGWDYKMDDVARPNFADVGYAKGVPMGGDLSNAPKDKSPMFIVAASKDPDGANLDRVQVIKGWLDKKGKLHEKVYDVALADGRRAGASAKSIGSTVDVEDASYTNTIGDPELSTVWTDPKFDPKERAFYYVRVIEIPTPRWTAFDKKFFKNEMPKKAKMVGQERAYTSPIWYTP